MTSQRSPFLAAALAAVTLFASTGLASADRDQPGEDRTVITTWRYVNPSSYTSSLRTRMNNQCESLKRRYPNTSQNGTKWPQCRVAHRHTWAEGNATKIAHKTPRGDAMYPCNGDGVSGSVVCGATGWEARGWFDSFIVSMGGEWQRHYPPFGPVGAKMFHCHLRSSWGLSVEIKEVGVLATHADGARTIGCRFETKTVAVWPIPAATVGWISSIYVNTNGYADPEVTRPL